MADTRKRLAEYHPVLTAQQASSTPTPELAHAI
jgi:hypothetical protein